MKRNGEQLYYPQSGTCHMGVRILCDIELTQLPGYPVMTGMFSEKGKLD